jgi:quinol monooxygenase YgiN
MIIAGGAFEVAAEHREEFLAARLDLIRTSRAEHGCLEYAFCADPLDAGRVILFERWETQQDLDAHLNGMRANPPTIGGPAPTAVSVVFYDAEPQAPAGA